MDDESAQDDQGNISEEPPIDTNRTVGNENLASEEVFEDRSSVQLPSQPQSSSVEAQPLHGKKSSPTRLRKGTQVVLYIAVLLIGIVAGALGILLFQLAIGGTRSPISNSVTPVTSGNVTVHADQSIITSLLQNSVQTIDLPANGSISNVQIQFTNGTQMNISGNYQVSVLGVPVTQPFTLDAQLIVDNCQVQVHILQANFSNISVTGLVSLFEDKINQKLAQLIPQNNLPGNIELCLVNVATDAQGINATFNLVVPSSVTPTAHIAKPIAVL